MKSLSVMLIFVSIFLVGCAKSPTAITKRNDTSPLYNIHISSFIFDEYKWGNVQGRFKHRTYGRTSSRLWEEEYRDYWKRVHYQLMDKINKSHVFSYDKSAESVELHVKLLSAKGESMIPTESTTNARFYLLRKDGAKITVDVKSIGRDGSFVSTTRFTNSIEESIDNSVNTFVNFLITKPKLKSYTKIIAPEDGLSFDEVIITGVGKTFDAGAQVISSASKVFDGNVSSYSASRANSSFASSLNDGWSSPIPGTTPRTSRSSYSSQPSSSNESNNNQGNKKQPKLFCYLSGDGNVKGQNSKVYFSPIFETTAKKRMENDKRWAVSFTSFVGGTGHGAGSSCYPIRSRIEEDRDRNFKNAKSSVRKYGVKVSWTP